MVIDTRNLDSDWIIEGDICIVGAGAAGISIALEFANTSYNVILLEGGGFGYEDEIQDLYDGKTTGQRYFPLKSTRLHYFGGTTGLWAGMSSPFDEIDFVEREWVANSGWPISKKDLDPFYARAHEILNLKSSRYDFEYWAEELPKMNSFPIDERIIYNKMWQHSKLDFGKEYRKTILSSKNIFLFTHANVVDIKTNNQIRKVDKIIAKNLNGKTFIIEAKKNILACGAIQNARLLLAANSQTSKGLGNQNDLVGRYFMEHVEVTSSTLKLSKPFKTSLYTINHGKTIANAELALSQEFQIKHRILNGTVSVFPFSVGQFRKPRIDTWQSKDPRKAAANTAKNWQDALRKAKNIAHHHLKDTFHLITRMEQAPNPHSRVTIGREKDRLGVPRANLNWELTNLERYSIRTLNLLIKEQLENTGFGKVELLDFLKDENDWTYPNSTNPGWHHIGTTKMSKNKKLGVVDANCQVHEISNLYIAGSSCFPTSAAPNPTLTIIALSIRLADYLKHVST